MATYLPTQADELKAIMSGPGEKCAVCKLLEEEPEGSLYYCMKCFSESESSQEEYYCVFHGKRKHAKKNHKFEEYMKPICELTVSASDIKELEYGKNALMAAIQDWLVDGSLKGMEIVRQVATNGSALTESAIVTANVIKNVASESGNVVKAGKDLAKVTIMKGWYNVAIVNAAVSGLLFLGEAFYLGYQWWKGRITPQEFVRRSCNSFARNLASFAGSTAGIMTGAAIGALCGPVGAIIGGIIGGFLLGTSCSMGADALFEKYWPNEEQKARRAALDAALNKYQFTEDDLKDPEKFNKIILDKRFRTRAKEVHPDRKQGNMAQFQLLLTEYGILLAIINGKQEFNVTEMIKKITLPL